jgi:predicted CopG family antitoxin
METTTVRVRKQTQEKLKKISVDEHISVTELIDRLVKKHEKSFWKGFSEEAKAFLDKEEIKSRKTFEKALKDGLSK